MGDSCSQRAGEGWSVRTHGPDAGTSSHRTGSFDVSAHAEDVRLTLPAMPENVALVRRMIVAFAEALSLPPEVVSDLRLAITEACTNVVRHAYRDAPGEIDVIARPEADGLEIIVSDSGQGIAPSRDAAGPGFGLGLISALADRLEIDHSPEQGSRVQMWFARRCPIPETV